MIIDTWSNEEGRAYFAKQKNTSKEKLYIESVIISLGASFIKEVPFAKEHDNLYKADYVITDRKIMIEYDGIVINSKAAFKTGGNITGHTSMVGFTKDQEKRNLAQIMGYRVLCYTALNYKNIERDLKELLHSYPVAKRTFNHKPKFKVKK